MTEQTAETKTQDELLPEPKEQETDGGSVNGKPTSKRKTPAAAKVAKQREIQLNEDDELVIKVVKEVDDDGNTVKRDVRVRFKSVAPYLLYEVTQAIEQPTPPTYINPKSEKEEFNYDSPQYELDMKAYQQEVDEAVADALILFGVEVIGEYPKEFYNDEWIASLRYTKVIDPQLNTDDEFTRKLLYKKFILGIAPEHIRKLTEMSSVTQEEIAQSRDSFQG
jgi:hypothetical protein